MKLTAAQIRKAVFEVRPEWKTTRRVKVRGDVIKLMIGLLDDQTVKLFNQHGTLYENKSAIADKLGMSVSEVFREPKYEVIWLSDKV